MGAAIARIVATSLCAVLISMAFTACRARPGDGGNPASASVAAILLFNGTGTSPGDVAAVEQILNNAHLSYSTIDSPHLNRMSESQIREYHLLIVPGGNFVRIGNSLTS